MKRNSLLGSSVELAAWWAVGFALWIATLAAVNAAELITGVLAAGVCAVLARVARRAMGGQPGPSARSWRRWLGWAVVVPVAAAADLARLVGWLFSGAPEPRPADRLVTLPVPGSNSAAAITWRQGATVAISSTPGSVVIGIEPDESALILDQLVAGWPALDRRVSS